MMNKMFVALALLGCCHLGSAFSFGGDDDADDRQIVVVAADTWLAHHGFNVTLTTLISGGLTAFLIIALILIVGRAVEETRRRSSNHGWNRNSYNYNGAEYTYAERAGILDDMANQLVLLAEAFKKYEVTETGCQLYAACEASRMAGRGRHGQLEKIIFEVLSVVSRPGNEYLYRDDPYMTDLMSAFRVGTIGRCDNFRKQCRRRSGY